MAAPSGIAAPPVALRSAGAADDAFLRELFVDSRPEFQLLPAQLLELQIGAQRAQYRRDHPDATDEIVTLAGDAVGRCWTATDEHELRLLDLAVRSDHRRQGIGRAVLGLVANRAAAAGRAVRLSVWPGNGDARSLYRAAGFTEAGTVGGYVEMRLDPGGRQ
jgi:ribosomal protein S18 acetylase RimI-like enzyme